MSAPVEKQLLEALAELEQAVRSMSSAVQKPDLRPLFSRIDGLAAQLPRGTDPSLVHYLQKKSYAKARLHLLGRDAENQAGNCRHVP